MSYFLKYMATGKHKRTKIVHALCLLARAIQTTTAINLTQAFMLLVSHPRPQGCPACSPVSLRSSPNVTFSARPPLSTYLSTLGFPWDPVPSYPSFIFLDSTSNIKYTQLLGSAVEACAPQKGKTCVNCGFFPTGLCLE